MFGTLAQTQMANLDRLKHLALPLDQRHFLLESNALIGTMMAHLDSTKAVIKILTHSRLDDMLRRTIATTRAYDAYCQSLAPWIDQIVESAAWTITLTIPTTTTASLVSTTCSVIEKYTQSSPQETPDVLRASPATSISSEQYASLLPLIKEQLRPLGERFVAKWEGAWQTLFSENEDRYSQATHAGRELLIQVLAHLAPDEAFTLEECQRHNVSAPSRKMRVRYIFRGHSAHTVDLINHTAGAFDSLYHVLTGEAHRRDDYHQPDETIAGYLLTLGGLLLTLLTHCPS